MATADTTADRSHLAVRTVVALTLLLAVGAALMSIGHAGINVPFLSGLGPGGDRVVLPAAIAFGIATALAVAVAVGALRRRSWAWALGLLLHSLIVLGSAMPFRGPASAMGIIIGAVTVAVLLSRSGRAAFLPAAR